MKRSWLVGALSVAVAIASVAAGGAPASAAPADGGTVKSLVIEDTSGGLHSTLTLTFDKPISAAEARRARSAVDSAQLAPIGDKMWCGGYISDVDANGRFSIQYYCGSTRTLPWGFQLAPDLQAIAVSSVSERGMSWWRNGYFGGQNAPHTVPASYQFHGTLTPVYAGNDVDYSDHLTFRHNLGSGGTASLAVAGSVVLQN